MSTEAGATVFVAEHNKSRRLAIRRALEGAGFRVQETESGRDLLEIVHNSVGRSPDLLLVDVQLPDISGFEVCRRLRSHPKAEHIPIIASSERALNSAEILECFESGADDCLTHPVPKEELTALVTARVRLHHACSQRLARVLQQQSEHLRTKLARVNTAIDVAQLGIWELTAQLVARQNVPVSTTVRLDRTCCELLGLDADRPMSIDELFGMVQPGDKSRVADQILAWIATYGSGRFHTECRIVRPDGTERWVDMRAHATRPSATVSRSLRITGTLADITDRKHGEAVLIRTEKVAALGRMAASLAHDINNPLSAIMNTLYLARTSLECPEPLRQLLDVADEHARQISYITRQALGFYRDSATPTVVSIDEIVDEVLQMFKGKLKAKCINVQRRVRNNDFRVVARPGELRQVFANLIANSLDAVEEGGTVAVRISRLTATRNGTSSVMVMFADNGKGIERSAIPHLFEPLFTTKGAAGTGLGLWVSKQLVEQSGGHIRVHSQTDPPHKGTAVSIILPAAPIAAE